MELDELKYQLKQKLEQTAPKTMNELEQMLRAKTASALDRIRRNMLFELWFCVVAVIVFAIVAITVQNTNVRIYFGAFSLLCLFFVRIAARLIAQTKQAALSSASLQLTLVATINTLSIFKKRYMQVTMMMLPVCLLFALALGYFNSSMQNANLAGLLTSGQGDARLFWFVALYLAGAMVGLYFFTRWYLKKLYGKYINNLKSYLAELQAG